MLNNVVKVSICRFLEFENLKAKGKEGCKAQGRGEREI